LRISITGSVVKTSSNERTQFNLGAGFGTYFHLIRKKIINLSSGPEISYVNLFKLKYESGSPYKYTQYLNMSINATLPVNIDLHITDVIHLHLSSDILHVRYRISKYEQFLIKTENNGFDVYLESIFTPSFGFFFLF